MNRVSRRTFLRQASMGAAVGVATTVPSFLRRSDKGKASSEIAAAPAGHVTQEGPLVAHIDDVNTGEISVMVGTRQVTYRNHEIARRLLSSAQ